MLLMIVPATVGFAGASFNSSSAFRLAARSNPPESEKRIAGGSINATCGGEFADTIVWMPNSVFGRPAACDPNVSAILAAVFGFRIQKYGPGGRLAQTTPARSA